MKKEIAVFERLNFFNKVISELLAVDVKIAEKDKALIFLSSLHSHMIISSLPCFTVRKLSSWRRLRQLSYLMDQKNVKSREQEGQGLVVKGRKEREIKKSKLIEGMSLLSQGGSLKE